MGYVSSDESVVVGHCGYNADSEAFYWTVDNEMQSIKDILTDCGLDLTGWIFGSTSGVSADSLTVVGNGINPQEYQEVWITTIPEPTTLLLLGFSVIMLRRKKT